MAYSRPAASDSLPTRALAKRKARASSGPLGGTPTFQYLMRPGQSCEPHGRSCDRVTIQI